ncbi:hypothetical protein DMENIID0001_058790 [Sergentomyia squamirostris]
MKVIAAFAFVLFAAILFAHAVPVPEFALPKLDMPNVGTNFVNLPGRVFNKTADAATIVVHAGANLTDDVLKQMSQAVNFDV